MSKEIHVRRQDIFKKTTELVMLALYLTIECVLISEQPFQYCTLFVHKKVLILLHNYNNLLVPLIMSH